MSEKLPFSHWLFIVASIACGLLMMPQFFAAGFLSKLAIILVLVAASAIALAIRAIRGNGLVLVAHPVSLAFAGFSITTALSIFFTQDYPTTSLFGLGAVGLWSGVIVWLLTALLQPEAEAADRRGQLLSFSTKLQQQFLVGLGYGIIGLALTTILEQLGIGPARWFNAALGFNLPTDLRFSLAGSPLFAAELGLVAGVAWVWQSLQHKRLTPFNLTVIAASVIVVALNTWNLMPGKIASIALPNWSASWSVLLDTLRTPKTALIGFGTESYTAAFARFKPIWMNGTNVWQLSFGSGSNWPLTLVVTQGLLSLGAWILVIIKVAQLIKNSSYHLHPAASVIIATFVLQLVLPFQVGLLILQVLAVTVLLIGANAELQVVNLKPKHSWTMIASWVLVLGVASLGWFYGKLYAAYNHLALADSASYHNEPLKLYEHQRQAVILSPYIDLVRRQYALTNLQIALGLSANPQATDTDRAQITQLVSQAIREAKAATIIDPNNTQNWIVLAEIYRNLGTAAKEANQWTVSSLVNAIQTDPTNPTLRLDLGLVLLDQNLQTEAAQSFNQAIELKPDLPGAYYQLGRVFKLNNQLDKTQTLWQKALSLLPATSEEYRSVESSLKELSSAIAATASARKQLPPVPTPTPTQSASESALLRLTKEGSQAVLNEANPLNTESTSSVVSNPTAEPQPNGAAQ